MSTYRVVQEEVGSGMQDAAVSRERLEHARAISTCRDSSNLLEADRRPVQSLIPLRYLMVRS